MKTATLKAPFGLTAKECEVLRLLARGHDAKSCASALGLSIHTINEHLRSARLKTKSSSSRGAARLLAGQEDPEFLVPQQLGISPDTVGTEEAVALHPEAPAGSRFASRWKILFMAAAFSVVAILVAVGVASAPQSSSIGASPKVVATMPRADAIVRPGPITISVTFNRPMRRNSYSFVQKSQETYPDCGTNRPTQSVDGRTFTMTCTVLPSRRYEIWFNDPPYLNFTSESGRPAVPVGLRFRTR